MGRVTGDNIHVIQQDDRPPSRFDGVRHACPEIAAPGRIFEGDVFDSLLVENVLVKGNGAHLVARRVGGIDAQILLHPSYGEVGVLLQVVAWNSG